MIVSWALRYCSVDMGLDEGHRLISRQFELFKKGRKPVTNQNGTSTEWVLVNPKKKVTNIDGINIKGKHNYNPSLALDFYAYVPGKPQLTWDVAHLTYIGASLIMIAEHLHLEGSITHKLRWGGNWDRDGDLADNTLYDRPHVELYKP